MLNRILGRSKAEDLTTEEVEQVAGAGCWTETVGTYYNGQYYYEADMYWPGFDVETYCN